MTNLLKRYGLPAIGSSTLALALGILLALAAGDRPAAATSPPTIAKAFGAKSIPPGGTTTLQFTIGNPNTGFLSGIGFVDTLPSGLVISTPNGLTGSCGGGTITATAGTDSVGLSLANLTGGSFCLFAINVSATTAGSKTNTTGAITSNEGGTGGTASAVITVVLSTATHDFNGNGKSDIAWRQNGTGAAAAWLMNGAAVAQGAGFGALDPNWKLVGQRDFNQDGKYDWLWYNTATGELDIWLMNGLAIQQSKYYGVVVPGTNWTIAGTSDFNSDGVGDILWYNNNNGIVAVWLMNADLTVKQATNVAQINQPWSIAQADGSGKIFWQDGKGNIIIWQMNGTSIAQTSGVLNIGSSIWSIVGVGDFDGNGSTDILWRDSNGNVATWLMNGLQLMPPPVLLGNVPTSWTIQETGDFNGDGKSDILWRDGAGNVAVWFMNGGQVTPASGAAVGTDWVIQGAGAD